MKLLKIILPVVCLLMAHLSFSQVGDFFPTIVGESLKNKQVELPKASKGKFCLVGMASSQKAEQDLQSWMQPIYEMFINQTTFIPIDYNLDIFFIPMFSGTDQAIYGKVLKKTKEEIDAELAPHVLFYKGNLKEYRTKLVMTNKDAPYFFVLDASGKIIYATSGAYTSKKLAQIEKLVAD